MGCLLAFLMHHRWGSEGAGEERGGALCDISGPGRAGKGATVRDQQSEAPTPRPSLISIRLPKARLFDDLNVVPCWEMK